MLRESWKVNALIAVLSGFVWVAAYLLNSRYMASFAHAPGIDLLFIPSGLRLMAILIGGIWAAVGVSLGSLYLTGAEFQTLQPWVIIAISACSGLCPYLALRASLKMTGVEPGLKNLSARKLPLISLGVAVGSSLLHNLLFSALGLESWQAFPGHALAMATGDFLGILLAMTSVFLLLRLVRRSAV